MRLLIPVTMAVSLAGLGNLAAQNPTGPAQPGQAQETTTTSPAASPSDVPLPPPPANVPELALPPVRTVDEAPGIETTYLSGQLPRLPWLPEEALDMPEWAVQPGSAANSPFLRPGLGTSALGDAPLTTRRSLRDSQPLRAGPFDLFPSVSFDSRYGSGLVSGPGRESDTWIQTLTPALSITAGDHWRLGYAPSLRFYSSDAYDSVVNHSIDLSGWAGYENWRFRLNHGTAITSDPLIETASQTDQMTHSTELGATMDRGLGQLDFALTQQLRFTDDYVDASSWGFQSWYDHSIRPRLRLGVGVGAGYDLIDPGTDMVSESLSVRLTGSLSEKIGYNLSLGGEARQFVDVDADTAINPLLRLGLSYQVLTRTAVSLSASHTINTSYYSDQFTENTAVQGAISQGLTERVSISASGGVRFTSYKATVGSLDEAREDDSVFARVGIRTRIEKRTSAALSYDYRTNSSDSSGYSFDSHQVSLSLDWAL